MNYWWPLARREYSCAEMATIDLAAIRKPWTQRSSPQCGKLRRSCCSTIQSERRMVESLIHNPPEMLPLVQLKAEEIERMVAQSAGRSCQCAGHLSAGAIPGRNPVPSPDGRRELIRI